MNGLGTIPDTLAILICTRTPYAVIFNVSHLYFLLEELCVVGIAIQRVGFLTALLLGSTRETDRHDCIGQQLELLSLQGIPQ